jgi:hypothetical protein
MIASLGLLTRELLPSGVLPLQVMTPAALGVSAAAAYTTSIRHRNGVTRSSTGTGKGSEVDGLPFHSEHWIAFEAYLLPFTCQYSSTLSDPLGQ